MVVSEAKKVTPNEPSHLGWIEFNKFIYIITNKLWLALDKWAELDLRLTKNIYIFFAFYSLHAFPWTGNPLRLNTLYTYCIHVT